MLPIAATGNSVTTSRDRSATSGRTANTAFCCSCPTPRSATTPSNASTTSGTPSPTRARKGNSRTLKGPRALTNLAALIEGTPPGGPLPGACPIGLPGNPRVLLPDPRPDDPEPPRQVHRLALPLGDLLYQRRAAPGRRGHDRRRRRLRPVARQGRHQDQPRRSLLGGR